MFMPKAGREAIRPKTGFLVLKEGKSVSSGVTVYESICFTLNLLVEGVRDSQVHWIHSAMERVPHRAATECRPYSTLHRTQSV